MKLDLARLLKIKHLKLIEAIAEYGQLSRAADIMSISQPAASRMLSDIEDLMGAPLFERQSKGMVPTQVGCAITKHASNILLELHDLSREVDELKHGVGGIATVGAVRGALVEAVIPAVKQLKEISPKVEIQLNVGNSPMLVRALVEGINDFVLARLPRDYDPNAFDIIPARPEILHLVIREDHPLAQSEEVELTDLEHYEWIIEGNGPLREALESIFFSASVRPPENIVNTTSLFATISLLISSNALALMSSQVTDLLISQGQITRLKVLRLREPVILAPYHLLQMKGRLLSPLANHLKSLILTTLEL